MSSDCEPLYETGGDGRIRVGGVSWVFGVMALGDM